MPALPTTHSRHRAVGNYRPPATHRTWQTTTAARSDPARLAADDRADHRRMAARPSLDH